MLRWQPCCVAGSVVHVEGIPYACRVDELREQDMGKPKDREGQADEFRRQYQHVAQRQIDEQQDEQGNFNFKDAGEDETLPGQQEIQSGSVEHIQTLKSYPTATHYGPDVNVKAEEPPEPPEPQPQTENDKRETMRTEKKGAQLRRQEGESDEDFRSRGGIV
jgi:glycerophosphoryl diester phosphodiesterase